VALFLIEPWPNFLKRLQAQPLFPTYVEAETVPQAQHSMLASLEVYRVSVGEMGFCFPPWFGFSVVWRQD